MLINYMRPFLYTYIYVNYLPKPCRTCVDGGHSTPHIFPKWTAKGYSWFIPRPSHRMQQDFICKETTKGAWDDIKNWLLTPDCICDLAVTCERHLPSSKTFWFEMEFYLWYLLGTVFHSIPQFIWEPLRKWCPFPVQYIQFKWHHIRKPLRWSLSLQYSSSFTDISEDSGQGQGLILMCSVKIPQL